MSLRQVNKQTKNPFNRCGAARATVFFHKKWFAAKRALPYQNRGSAPRQHITKNKNGRDSSIARGSNNNGYLKRKLQPKLASACGFREKTKTRPEQPFILEDFAESNGCDSFSRAQPTLHQCQPVALTGPPEDGKEHTGAEHGCVFVSAC